MCLDVYIGNVKSDGFDFDVPEDYNGCAKVLLSKLDGLDPDGYYLLTAVES